jgi:hypothetical protein
VTLLPGSSIVSNLLEPGSTSFLLSHQLLRWWFMQQALCCRRRGTLENGHPEPQCALELPTGNGCSWIVSQKTVGVTRLRKHFRHGRCSTKMRSAWGLWLPCNSNSEAQYGGTTSPLSVLGGLRVDYRCLEQPQAWCIGVPGSLCTIEDPIY